MDAAGGRLLYAHGGKIWIRTRAGVSHVVANLRPATFNADGSLVVFDKVTGTDTSSLYTYTVSNGRATKLLDLPAHENDDLRIVALRYSLDGKYLWMAYGYDQTQITDFYRLTLSTLELKHMTGLKGLCTVLEMLPGNTQLVTVCDTGFEVPRKTLIVLRLSDGKLTRLTPVQDAMTLTSIHGRVDPHHLLVSYFGYIRSTDRVTGSWLGTMDTRTFAIKRIPGSAHLYRSVAEYG